MITFEVFFDQLHVALTRLHDPDYEPPESLCEVLGTRCGPTAGEIQTAIIKEVANLVTLSDGGCTGRPQREHEVLHHRFVLGLTQEEAADRLHMSVRTLGRVQREAIHALARCTWERRPESESGTDLALQEAEAPSDWRTQMRENLAALRARAPELVSDISSILASASERVGPLAEERGSHLRLRPVDVDVQAAVHPSVFRQIIIMAVSQLLEIAQPGSIDLCASAGDGVVLVELHGRTARPSLDPSDLVFLRELLSLCSGSLDVVALPKAVTLCLRVPMVGKVRVLVVDDNPDSVHYYRRCLERTRFKLLHAKEGGEALRITRTERPDIIVLDIMLPDMDGWELLENLRADPTSALIPVIVCSIVREGQLASTLGAVRYLPKPVRDIELLQALEEASSEEPRESAKTEAQKQAAC